MKKLFALLLALSLLVVPCLSLAEGELDAIRERGYLKVGVKSDVPGFGLLDPATNTYSGLEIDLARYVAAEIFGVDVADVGDYIQFFPVTAKTRGPELDNGNLDMDASTFTIKPERLELYEFSKPYYVDSVGLMVLKDSGIASFDDLLGDETIIGVAQGSTTRDALTAAAAEKGVEFGLDKFDEMVDYPTIKEALLAHQIDCFSVDKSILGGYLDDSVVILPDSFTEGAQPYGIAIKKGNTELLALVDEVVARLRADGTIDEIVASYPELAPVDWDVVDAHTAELWPES